MNNKPKVGREFQHLEDLVFIEGSSGALRALCVLKDMTVCSDATIKWDGNPTIYWGRNQSGEFVLINKNAWGRTECTSPGMLEEFILTSGKGESWRQSFADSLIGIWAMLEAATPYWFRGYVFGDLLFYPNKSYTTEDNAIRFTPNKVTYSIDKDSELGYKLADAKVCIAAHKLYNNFGDTESLPIQESSCFEGKAVVIIAQTNIQKTVQFTPSQLCELEQLIEQNYKEIDSFLDTPIKGLSDIKNIIYRYVNQTSKLGELDHLGDTFFNWLSSSSVSIPKQTKIIALCESNPTALPAIFMLVKNIMNLKNIAIDQLDENIEIKSFTGNQSGGEGYILLKSSVKLVPRHRWVCNF